MLDLPPQALNQRRSTLEPSDVVKAVFANLDKIAEVKAENQVYLETLWAAKKRGPFLVRGQLYKIEKISVGPRKGEFALRESKTRAVTEIEV